MSRTDLPLLRANLHAAVERACEATSMDLPFDRLMRFEDELEVRGRREAEEPGVDHYESWQFVVGVRGFFRYLTAGGIEVHAIMPRLWAAGACWHVQGYELTRTERRWMFGESAKAVAWRLRLLFGEVQRDQWLAVVRFTARTKYSAREDLRFEDFLAAEDDGLDGLLVDDDFRIRRRGVRAVLEFCSRCLRSLRTADGSAPGKAADRGTTLERGAMRIMRELWTVGRGMRVEPFRSMTMDEAGAMLAETKANHSHRGKKLSRMIERVGMRGSQLPGQKGKHTSASYAEVAKRTCNRRAHGAARAEGAAPVGRKLKPNFRKSQSDLENNER